jgi:hypothetical protein
MEENKNCRIPVRATYRIIDGEPVRVDAEYVDLPADAIARFLLQKFGVDAIFKEGVAV